ncbi:MAG: menaquinone biosynthesis protein [Bacteroidales bacterium]|nr:menaquinone biosynthesis protein [Bacteroidales bacterium]
MLKVSCVSYINSYPFVYGLSTYSNLKKQIELDLCRPSLCAESFLFNNSDISLLPVGALPHINKPYKIITDFCIGAVKSVETVILFSNYQMDDIQTVYIDTDSVTSAQLIKILFRELWCKEVAYIAQSEPLLRLPENSAYLAIGDKCFSLRKEFKFAYDLFEAWHELTNLPFVFAAWVSKSTVSHEFAELFNKALEHGILNKEKALKAYIHKNEKSDFNELLSYLENNISYSFDLQKQKALDLYLSKISK